MGERRGRENRSLAQTMKILAAFFFTVVMLTQGCGYTAKSGLAPEWKTIYVAPVVNAVNFTSPHDDNLYAPLLEVKLRDGVSQGFLRGGYLKIADNPDDADLVLKMFLKYYRHNPLRYDNDDNVTEWSVVVSADYELWDNLNGELIQTEGIGGSQERFRIGPNAVSEDAAIDEAVDDLGTRIVERMVEYWGSSQFLTGDLDVPALRQSLQALRKPDLLVLKALRKTVNKLRGVTEPEFVRAFNIILKMPDFHARVDADMYRSSLSKEIKKLLVSAERSDATLSESEYLKLNKALLLAIYPHETRKIKSQYW